MPKPRVSKCKVNTTDEHYKAIVWCFKNNIIIRPVPKFDGVWLEISVRKRPTMSPVGYNNCEASQKIWDLYLKLYNKYKKIY